MTATPGLLPYQRAWVRDQSPLKVAEKSRRIGWSWTEAYDNVMHAAAGRGNVWYQTFAHDAARGYIQDCAEWVEALQPAASEMEETLLDLDDGHSVQATQIRFDSGCKITGMSSAPRVFRSRGKPGDIGIVDEAAHMSHLPEVLKSVMAFTIWGGKVRVFSSHNGQASPFNRLCRDIEKGRKPGSLHHCTFNDAARQGLYRKVCERSGKAWSLPEELAWRYDVRRYYGEDAREELDVFPTAGGGAWLSWKVIQQCQDAAAGDPAAYAGGRTIIGVDIARRVDLWVATVVEPVGDVLWVRGIAAKRNISFAQQEAIIAALRKRFRATRIIVDQTGMGEAVVERYQEKWGSQVEGVLLTGPTRLSLATVLRDEMSDRRVRIPEGEDLQNDLRSMVRVVGSTGIVRLEHEGGDDGHADRFWSLALAVAGAKDPARGVEGEAAADASLMSALELGGGWEDWSGFGDLDAPPPAGSVIQIPSSVIQIPTGAPPAGAPSGLPGWEWLRAA